MFKTKSLGVFGVKNHLAVNRLKRMEQFDFNVPQNMLL